MKQSRVDQYLEGFEVVNLTDDRSHGHYLTLEEAQGCVAFDRLTNYRIVLNGSEIVESVVPVEDVTADEDCPNSCCRDGVLTNGNPCPTCRGSGQRWSVPTALVAGACHCSKTFTHDERDLNRCVGCGLPITLLVED